MKVYIPVYSSYFNAFCTKIGKVYMNESDAEDEVRAVDPDSGRVFIRELVDSKNNEIQLIGGFEK